MNEIPVRIDKAMIYELVFDRMNVVNVEPFALRQGELTQRPMLVSFALGWAQADVDVTINTNRLSYVKKRFVPFIHAAEYVDDEDGNEVLVWGVADYPVASKLQFHHSNHYAEVDPRAIDCACGVVVAERDSEGVAIRWDVTL